MNFHDLSRKELQALCKKNKIPANITNVAMADSLSALPQVEGLDEILNPREGDVGTPAIQQRTSTQRKAVKGSERSKVSTQPSRGARAVVEQENEEANVSATPAMVPSSRRRVPAVSTRRKKEVIVIEDGDDDKNDVQGKVPKTPAAAPSSMKRATGRSLYNKKETPSGTSVQKGYSPRRSVRLLGKSLSEMSLMETEDMGLSKVDDVCEELSGVSQHEEDSSNTEKGASLQTISTVLAENTEDSEVSSLNKVDSDCQSRNLGSEVKSGLETKNDAENEMHAETKVEGLEKVNQDEAAYECQPNNLVSEVKIVSETEQETKNELHAEPQEEGSEKVNLCDAEDESQAEPQEEGSEKNDEYELHDSSFDARDESTELLPILEESCDSAKQDAFSGEVSQDTNEAGSSDAAKPEDNESSTLKESCDSAKLEDKEYDGIKQEPLSVAVSEEASLEIADKCIAESHEAGSELIELQESGDSAELENKECFGNQPDVLSAVQAITPLSVEVSAMEIGDQDITPVVESDDDCVPKQCVHAHVCVPPSVEGNSEGDDEILDQNHDDVDEHSAYNQNSLDDENQENKKIESLNVSDGNRIQNFDANHDDAEEQAADKKDVSSSEAVLGMDSFTSEQKQEPEEKNEVCVEEVTHQLSLLGVVVENEASDKVEHDTTSTNPNMMKENRTPTSDYENMSMRGLIKKLKEMNGKVNNKTDCDTGHMQEVEKKKRTALQALSQNNKVTTGDVHHEF